MIEINGNKYRNIQEQVKKNMDDIAEIKESGGTEYTAGTGIDITEDVISVDTDTVAMKSDIPSYIGGTGIEITNNVIEVDNNVALKIDLPAAVSGTNDGTNWTSLTVGEDTYDIPSGGSAQLYQHNVVYKALNSNSKIVTYFTAQFVSNSATAISSKARLIAYLDGSGFSSDTSSIDQTYLPVNGSTITTMSNSIPGRIYGIHYNTEEDEIYLISDYGDVGSNQYISVSYNADNYSTVTIRDKVITL